MKLQNIEQQLGTNRDLTIKTLSLYAHDRVGVIGDNGAGKTTLLNLISGRLVPDRGYVQRWTTFAYYQQVGKLGGSTVELDGELLSRFHVPKEMLTHFSGGEAAKFRLTQTLSTATPGMLLDEPTSHLDAAGVDLLLRELRNNDRTLVVVSHDRYFLDHLVTQIWEVAHGHVTAYPGNYTAYLATKEAERVQQAHQAADYRREEHRLQRALTKKQQQATRLAHVTKKQKRRQIKPDRLSSSKQKDTVQKGVQKSAKSIAGKLARLTSVKGPSRALRVRFPLPPTLTLHNPYPVMGERLTLTRGDRILLQDAHFQFANGQKIALVGQNGSGKTTLLAHILAAKPGIVLSPKVVFSVYHQFDYQLSGKGSLLNVIRQQSDYPESTIRSVLHQLGFSQAAIGKPVSTLSGGETVKVALALTFLRPANVLVLDEPTNFLDLTTIVALQDLIAAYPGLVLFATHDRYLVEQCATAVYKIDHAQLHPLKRENFSSEPDEF